MFDMRSEAKKKTVLDSTTTMNDAAFDMSLLSRSRSSCTDRLEARILKSFLAQGGNTPGRRAIEEQVDVSLLYSERETYPAASARKIDRGRLSGTRYGHASTPEETKMREIMDKERAMRVFRPPISSPEKFSGANRENGVRFRFRRGSPVKNDMLAERVERLTLTDGKVDARAGNALVTAQSLKCVADPEYTALVLQLAEIESLVDSIESCMRKPVFWELAARVVREMQLLMKATQQIRTDGTTLILANVHKDQNADFTHALRRLVARAASAQQRIRVLMDAIMQLGA